MKRKLKLFFVILMCLYICIKMIAFFFMQLKIQKFFREPYNYIALTIFIPVVLFLVYKIFQKVLSDFHEREMQDPDQPMFRMNYGLATIVFIIGLIYCYDMLFNNIDKPGENWLLRQILNIFILLCTIFLGGFLFYKIAQWYNNRKDPWL